MKLNIISILPFFFKRHGKVAQSVILLLFVLLTVACKEKTFDSEEALWEYIKEESSPYVHYKSVKGIDFSLTYRPTDILVNQEITANATHKTIDSLRSKYEEYLYFNVTFSKNNKEVLNSLTNNRSQFSAMINQLAFKMADKVHLYTSKNDTIPMLDYIYPRMYGMSSNTNMLLVYPRTKKVLNQEYFFLTVEDVGFGTGEIRFKIKTSSLKEEPRLVLKH